MLGSSALRVGLGSGGSVYSGVGPRHSSGGLLLPLPPPLASLLRGCQGQVRIPLQRVLTEALLLGVSHNVPEGGHDLHHHLPLLLR